MILAIIKGFFDFVIIHMRLKNASIKIEQLSVNDNFTMLKQSCFKDRCEYNHIEIQSKTILNLQLFECIVIRYLPKNNALAQLQV